MLKLLFIFNLIQTTLSEYLSYCDYIYDKQLCIDTFYCAWCNVTTPIADSFITNESCIFKNTCSNLFNDTNCIINPNNSQRCNFVISTVNILLFIMYFVITYTLIYSTKKIIDIDTNKILFSFIGIVIITSVFIPSFILWFTGSSYYLPYILALITMTIILCIFSNSYDYRRRNNMRYYTYQPIST
jgi:uncharacterized protein YacL